MPIVWKHRFFGGHTWELSEHDVRGVNCWFRVEKKIDAIVVSDEKEIVTDDDNVEDDNEKKEPENVHIEWWRNIRLDWGQERVKNE